MNIGLFHTGVGPFGGVERACAETARCLMASGNNVHVHSARIDTRLISEGVIGHPVPVIASPHSLFLFTFRVFGGKSLKRAHHDITHSCGALPGCDVVTAHSCHKAGLIQAKRFFTTSVGRRRNLGIADSVRLFIEREVYRKRRFRQVIAVSNGTKKELMEYYGLGDEDVVVIPNGVNTTQFSPGIRDQYRADIRRMHGIAEEDTVILFMGNEFARKGLDSLVRALGGLRGLPVVLLVCGGDDPGPYQSLARALGVESHMRFAGLCAEVQRYYAASDLLAHPAFHEAFGLVITEAMASGLPVVVSKNCGAAEDIFRPDVDGILIEDPANHIEIRSALRTLISDPALRRRLGGNASGRAVHYSWERCIHEVEKVYDTVIRKKAHDAAS